MQWRDELAVHVLGRRIGRVAEPFGYDDRVDAGSEQQCRVGVSELADRDRRNVCSLDEPPEGVRERLGIQLTIALILGMSIALLFPFGAWLIAFGLTWKEGGEVPRPDDSSRDPVESQRRRVE